jgi:hypothetical protein
MVHDVRGERVGRVEDLVAERQPDGEWVVTEYLVGAMGVLERLSALGIMRTLLKHLGVRRRGYRVPWRVMDLSQPTRPRVTCPRDELETYGFEGDDTGEEPQTAGRHG